MYCLKVLSNFSMKNKKCTIVVYKKLKDFLGPFLRFVSYVVVLQQHWTEFKTCNIWQGLYTKTALSLTSFCMDISSVHLAFCHSDDLKWSKSQLYTQGMQKLLYIAEIKN